MVKADIPGLDKEDIDISVHGDTLTIKGEKKEEKESKDKGLVKTERFYGSFNRSLTLPSEVDAAKVKASYNNGVLELTLPKKEESKPKQIKIDVE
jgi:HSP20 family protein